MNLPSNAKIDVFREQILQAAKTGTPLSIEGGGTKSWLLSLHTLAMRQLLAA